MAEAVLELQPRGAINLNPAVGNAGAARAGSIPVRRATASHFAQRVISQYSPRRRKHGGRPRLTGMNCRF